MEANACFQEGRLLRLKSSVYFKNGLQAYMKIKPFTDSGGGRLKFYESLKSTRVIFRRQRHWFARYLFGPMWQLKSRSLAICMWIFYYVSLIMRKTEFFSSALILSVSGTEGHLANEVLMRRVSREWRWCGHGRRWYGKMWRLTELCRGKFRAISFRKAALRASRTHLSTPTRALRKELSVTSL